jgi:hypothetical protein
LITLPMFSMQMLLAPPSPSNSKSRIGPMLGRRHHHAMDVVQLLDLGQIEEQQRRAGPDRLHRRSGRYTRFR